MFKRSYVTIDQSKTKDFKKFLAENVKDSSFWERNKQEAFHNVDEKEIERLFSGKK